MTQPSYSVCQLARHWRVCPSKIRRWIRDGLLQAFGVGSGRRELRITPEAVAAFEAKRSVSNGTHKRRASKIELREIEELESVLSRR
jgi:transposase-like protein